MKNTTILRKLLAIILALSFPFQDIVWACPGPESAKPSFTLQVLSELHPLDPKIVLGAALRAVLDKMTIDIGEYNIPITPPIPYLNDVEVSIDFGGKEWDARAGKWVVPCSIKLKDRDDGWKYDALIEPDKNFELKPRSPEVEVDGDRRINRENATLEEMGAIADEVLTQLKPKSEEWTKKGLLELPVTIERGKLFAPPSINIMIKDKQINYLFRS
jgi:hypothetical protein